MIHIFFIIDNLLGQYDHIKPRKCFFGQFDPFLDRTSTGTDTFSVGLSKHCPFPEGQTTEELASQRGQTLFFFMFLPNFPPLNPEGRFFGKFTQLGMIIAYI
jgi:hypothetical protein